jgi:hypothetical protein
MMNRKKIMVVTHRYITAKGSCENEPKSLMNSSMTGLTGYLAITVRNNKQAPDTTGIQTRR